MFRADFLTIEYKIRLRHTIPLATLSGKYCLLSSCCSSVVSFPLYQFHKILAETAHTSQDIWRIETALLLGGCKFGRCWLFVNAGVDKVRDETWRHRNTAVYLLKFTPSQNALQVLWSFGDRARFVCKHRALWTDRTPPRHRASLETGCLRYTDTPRGGTYLYRAGLCWTNVTDTP